MHHIVNCVNKSFQDCLAPDAVCGVESLWKRVNMEEREIRAVTVDSAELKEDKPPASVVNLSLEEIEQRAAAKAAILNAILAEEQRPSWRHWGLNE